jgi:drug/metabolite transporter (DMT)-like permease
MNVQIFPGKMSKFKSKIAYSDFQMLIQRMSVVDFTFCGIANPIAGILSGYILMNDEFSAEQYFLMGLMIVTSLLPQLIIIFKNKIAMRRLGE